MAIPKENEIELSQEDAEAFIDEFRECELADDELDNVAGGAEGCKPSNPYKTVYWDREEDVQFIFNVGNIVEAFVQSCEHHTASCMITNRRTSKRSMGCVYKYYDEYYLEKQPGGRAVFIDDWRQRKEIEK